MEDKVKMLKKELIEEKLEKVNGGVAADFDLPKEHTNSDVETPDMDGTHGPIHR